MRGLPRARGKRLLRTIHPPPDGIREPAFGVCGIYPPARCGVRHLPTLVRHLPTLVRHLPTRGLDPIAPEPRNHGAQRGCGQLPQVVLSSRSPLLLTFRIACANGLWKRGRPQRARFLHRRLPPSASLRLPSDGGSVCQSERILRHSLVRTSSFTYLRVPSAS